MLPTPIPVSLTNELLKGGFENQNICTFQLYVCEVQVQPSVAFYISLSALMYVAYHKIHR